MKRSIPLKNKYNANNCPGIFILVRNNHKTENKIKQTIISYSGVGYTAKGNSLQNRPTHPGIGMP